MRSSNYLISAFSVFVLAVFVIPISMILFQVVKIDNLETELLFSSFIYVITQSILSASFSVLIGLVIALSYLKKSQKVQKTISWGLLPQALPTVLIVFAYFKIFSIFNLYPQSYIHVILVHVLINMGLVNFLIFPHLQEQIEKKIHLMLSLDLSFFRFFKMILWGELLPTIFYIWILILSFSLTSFTVPLLLSGSVPSSLDYLIYLKGYIEGDWASASLLGLIEFVFLGCLFFLRSQKLSFIPTNTNMTLLLDKKSIWYLLNFLPILLVIISLLHFGNADFSSALQSLGTDLKDILFNTSFLVLWTLWCYSFIFWTQVYLMNILWVRKFHQFFWPLSPILLSFVILNFAELFSDSIMFKIAFSGLAISIFVFPIVFKFWILPEYANFDYFFSKSEILNLPYDKVFSKVMVPYLYPYYKTSLVYVLLFTLGDFTISGILLADLKTIGLSMRTYIQSYQLIEAQLLAIILTIISLGLILKFKAR